MKKLLLFSIAAVMMLSLASNLDAKNYKQSISIDPLDFLVSKVLNVTYEHQLSKENSFTVFFSYYSYSEYWTAYGIGGSYRWYLTDLLKDKKIPIEGLSVGPMVRASFWSNDYGYDLDNSVYLVIGGEAAYKWTFNDFVVEPILRLGFGVTDVAYLGYSGWGAGVNVGYAW